MQHQLLSLVCTFCSHYPATAACLWHISRHYWWGCAILEATLPRGRLERFLQPTPSCSNISDNISTELHHHAFIAIIIETYSSFVHSDTRVHHYQNGPYLLSSPPYANSCKLETFCWIPSAILRGPSRRPRIPRGCRKLDTEIWFPHARMWSSAGSRRRGSRERLIGMSIQSILWIMSICLLLMPQRAGIRILEVQSTHRRSHIAITCQHGRTNRVPAI